MSGADFIIAINLTVAGSLAATFLALGVFGERREAAHAFGLCYVLGALNFLLEFMLPRLDGLFLVGFGAYAAFLAAVSVFNLGLARLYERPGPWLAIAVVFAGGCLTRVAIEAMPRDLLLRQFAYQLPYAVLQAMGAALVWQSRRRRLDNVLLVMLGLSALHFLLKPLFAALGGGVGTSAGTYSSTFYAMISQASGTVLGIGVALLLFIVLVRDALDALVARSERDPLSGLLNRRGFEERRDIAVRQRSGKSLPVSLVLCDLDGFKSVNDTYGHDAGDRVIVAFGRLLLETAAEHQAVARVGGEEFAILLPGANLAAARLFAENLRLSFAMSLVPGFRVADRFTASFGVAEARPGETGSQLQARADLALYAAKRQGRDCVRTATNPRVADEPLPDHNGKAWLV